MAAMLAGIEIYNKPRFDYRDECFVILVIDAWELLLKALLSKQRNSIFYKKRRHEPYRTLSWRDALNRAAPFFPKGLEHLPVAKNLELLATYRDNAVHFYNVEDFGSLIYALAQTSIVNFRDLLEKAFSIDLGEEITWQLLPLGLKPPIDPIVYISRSKSGTKGSAAVKEFISALASAAQEIEKTGADTGRLLTAFNVKLESTKKIESADVVVGVKKPDESQEVLVVARPMDPNVTHPLRQKDVLERITAINGIRFTGFVFQAIAWKYEIKNQTKFCWQAAAGVLTTYSNDLVAWITQLSPEATKTAIEGYKAHLRARRAKSK
jgi:hypothetical protein